MYLFFKLMPSNWNFNFIDYCQKILVGEEKLIVLRTYYIHYMYTYRHCTQLGTHNRFKMNCISL